MHLDTRQLVQQTNAIVYYFIHYELCTLTKVLFQKGSVSQKVGLTHLFMQHLLAF